MSPLIPQGDPVDMQAQVAKQLQDLHDQHGDWHTALANYSPEPKTPQAIVSGHSLTDVLQKAAASPRAVGILQTPSAPQSLVTTPDQLPALMSQEPPPGKTIASMKTGSTKRPTVGVSIDHQDPPHPDSGSVVGIAEKYLGTPFLMGGADPRKGFDGAGFAHFLYRLKGVNLPRSAAVQARMGQQISDPAQLQPGDLVVMDGGNGVYVGDGQFIHASDKGDAAKLSSLNTQHYSDRFIQGRRIIPQGGQ